MKLILGDNQFFGVNHADLEKAAKTRELFSTQKKISKFINKSLNLGLDGFMINSNELGFKVIEEYDFKAHPTECHYSIPYPHKYAGIVNESGMTALIKLVLRQLRLRDLFLVFRFMLTWNAIHLLPVVVRMEIPKSLPKGSIIYLQNVITDMTLGLQNGEKILGAYIKCIQALGYKPGLITLNPAYLFDTLSPKYSCQEIYLCFNINYSGFNVFPNVLKVESTICELKQRTKWKLMGMSVFSSGSQNISIDNSINYINKLDLDYVVFGSSRLSNIETNINNFRK